MLKTRFLLLAALLASVGLLVSACGSSGERAADSLGGFAAKVDDDTLSHDELVELNEATEGEPVNLTLSNWIVETLVDNTLEEEGITLSEGDLANGRAISPPGATDEAVRRAAGQARVAYEYSDVDPPTADEVAAAAAASPAIAETCASHILLESEEEADAVLVRLDNGEDFATVAMETSTGPSGPNGGDLGCVAPGQFVPEFEEAMNAATIGEPTEPVQSDFGWHVILVTDRTMADLEGPAVLDSARLAIINSQIDALREAYLAFLVDSADRVEVDPRYGEWVPEEGLVVPAEGSDPAGVDTTSPAPAEVTSVPSSEPTG